MTAIVFLINILRMFKKSYGLILEKKMEMNLKQSEQNLKQESRQSKVQLHLLNISNITENGLSILDIYGQNLTEEYFSAGMKLLDKNFNTNYVDGNREKLKITFKALKDLH